MILENLLRTMRSLFMYSTLISQPLVLKKWIPDFIQEKTFPYLTNTSNATGSGYVAKLNFKTFKANEIFDVCGVKFTPLVVAHGKSKNGINTCLGYRFGKTVYLSGIVDIIFRHRRRCFRNSSRNKENNWIWGDRYLSYWCLANGTT